MNGEVIAVVPAALVDQIRLTFTPSESADSLSLIRFSELLP